VRPLDHHGAVGEGDHLPGRVLDPGEVDQEVEGEDRHEDEVQEEEDEVGEARQHVAEPGRDVGRDARHLLGQGGPGAQLELGVLLREALL